MVLASPGTACCNSASLAEGCLYFSGVMKETMSMPETTSEQSMMAVRGHAGLILPEALLRTLLLVWLLGMLAACVPTVQHQANDRLVDQLGVPKGRDRLKDVLSRSINPQVVEADVTEDFFHYRYRQAIAGFATGAILENKVFFLNAGRVDVFENNTVHVYTSASHPLAQFVFGSGEDARTFADLVASFRARRSSTAR
jgi:hypothetical protein